MVIRFINTATYIITQIITTVKGFLHQPQNELTILPRKQSFGSSLLIGKLENPNVKKIGKKSPLFLFLLLSFSKCASYMGQRATRMTEGWERGGRERGERKAGE